VFVLSAVRLMGELTEQCHFKLIADPRAHPGAVAIEDARHKRYLR
jgi:hypothetical protein